MNLIAAAPTWLLVVVPLLLIAAAIEDAARLRISNITCLGVLVTALIVMTKAGFPASLWQNAVVFAALLLGGTLLFGAGRVGGGDVKLLAALGAWMSFGGAVWLLAGVFLCGGVLAILVIMLRAWRRHAREQEDEENTRGIPYGVAIAVGAGIAFAAQMGLIGSTTEKPNPLAVRPLGS